MYIIKKKIYYNVKAIKILKSLTKVKNVLKYNSKKSIKHNL